MSIQPENNDLREKINEDEYRRILSEINKSYEVMEQFINNLKNDIASVDDLTKQLNRDKEQGYDIGTSLDTLEFQGSTLKIDLNFFTHMKKVYMSKLYGDLYKYCDLIIDSAIAIENNPMNKPKEEIKSGKFAGVRAYINDSEEFTMSEIFNLLGVTERNLMELANDIATFSNKIDDARRKEKRGFSVGNLIVNLESQKTKLTLEFDSYCTRLEQFLNQNKNFSSKCLKRIEMISNEIVSEEEQQQQEEEEVSTPPTSEDEGAEV